jgi:dsRNA-specific ribonuclease
LQLVPTPANWNDRLSALQARIGVRFDDVTLLQCALTHSGVLSLNILPPDAPACRLANRSIEFLGDSILGFVAASHVFQTQPSHQEGQLSITKAALVNNQVLSRICEHHLGMHELILVNNDYCANNSSSKAAYVRGRSTIQAGAVEALIAAIYLDQVGSPSPLHRSQHCLLLIPCEMIHGHQPTGDGNRRPLCEHARTAPRDRDRQGEVRLGAG